MRDLNDLLDKTSDWDKDERYMATSDLCTELQKDVKIDATLERRICSAVLKQLDDQSNDVQSIAVKCLGVLLNKVHEAQVGEISEKLCSLILDGKDELRDIYSIGLKTLLKDVPSAMGPSVCDRLTQRLLSGVAQDLKVEVKLEALENLTDLLKRFGHVVRKEHATILETVLAQLANTGSKAVVRKRASACLAALASSADEALLERLFSTLLARIEANDLPDEKNAETTRTLIGTIGTISRAVGGRLGRHLDAVVPVFIKHIGDDQDEDSNTEEMNELRENCFHGLESFVLRCTREITPHIAALLETSMTFTAYDPNYQYDEDEAAMDEEEDEEEEEEEEEEEDYGDDEDDDDDASWKVRRAAIKLCAAIVSARPEMLGELYEKVGPVLIGRFKEREESVRVDVIETVTALLKAGGGRPDCYAALSAVAPSAMNAALKQLASANKKSGKCSAGPHQKSGAEKARAATYGMLRALCVAQPDLLGSQSKELVAVCEVGLGDKSQPLKLDAAALLRAALESQAASCFAPHLLSLLPRMAELVSQDWYKLIAEGLRLVATTAALARPDAASDGRSAFCPEAASGGLSDADLARLAKELHAAVEPRLQSTDMDHEIKECAITAIGAVATRLGDKLLRLPGSAKGSSLLSEVLATLSDRLLRNESTRLSALRALGEVASSRLSLDVSLLVRDETVSELCALLAQQSRTLKQTALETLRMLVEARKVTTPMSPAALTLILGESARLVTDEDLRLAQLAIHASVAALRLFGKGDYTADDDKIAQVAASKTLPAALALACSPLLSGQALASVGDLFAALGLLSAHSPKLSFEALWNALRDALAAPPSGSSSSSEQQRAPRQALGNVGLTLATMCVNKPEETDWAVKELVASLSAASSSQGGEGSSTTRRQVATLALGELGRRVALDSSVWAALCAAVTTPNTQGGEEEHNRASAAAALGLVTSGGLAEHLEPLLSTLDKACEKSEEYLLLLALKEVCVASAGVISCSTTKASSAKRAVLSAAAPRALARLRKSADSADEPTGNMVAECLGALAAICPAQVAETIDALLSHQASTTKSSEAMSMDIIAEDEEEKKLTEKSEARVRWTACASLKHAASLQPARMSAETAEVLRPRVKASLALLEDPDLNVKRQAAVMLNACVHHQLALVPRDGPRGELIESSVVAMLAKLAELKLERVVDLGPFKHKVDDGLPVRKAALACVSTLVEVKLVSCESVTSCVTAALSDKTEDCEMVAQQIVAKICVAGPAAITDEVLAAMVDALEKTVTKKTPKKDTKLGGTEAERAMALVRSALKAALALANLPSAAPARDLIAKFAKKEKLAAEMARLDPKMVPAAPAAAPPSTAEAEAA